MAVSLNEYRAKIRSTQSMKQITRAMELIAASRIVTAQQQAAAAEPYAREITRAVATLASFSHVDHPLTLEKENPTRAAVLAITSDRGLAGAYSANVLRETEQLVEKLHAEGKEVSHYLAGRKAVTYFDFRERDYAQAWTGFSEKPVYDNARQIGKALQAAFYPEGQEEPISDDLVVDELHIVFTRFKSMLSQQPEVIRLLPLEVVEGSGSSGQGETLPLYEFEPSPEHVLDSLLPKYIDSRIYFCLMQAAASELASRQRAMQAATDNADDLIETYTRIANRARQAQITQEISEIVGGANALAESGSE